MRYRVFILFFAFVGVFTGGCEKGPPSGPPQVGVSGKVTFDGKPLPGGRLLFHDKQGKAVGSAEIKGDGTYKTVLAPGELLVAVDTKAVLNQQMAAAKGHTGGVSMSPEEFNANKGKAKAAAEKREYVPIPEKYQHAQQSGLSITVVAGANVEKNFDLK